MLKGDIKEKRESAVRSGAGEIPRRQLPLSTQRFKVEATRSSLYGTAFFKNMRISVKKRTRRILWIIELREKVYV